jgi:hypothetical protein
MNRLLAVMVCLALSGAARADPLHDPWDALLAEHVSHADGLDRVAYDRWRGDDDARGRLDAYIASLEAARPSGMEPDAAFAYWANLYNALTVRLILDEAPSRSIRQIRPSLFSIGPWGMALTEVEGETLSLDDIEHAIMRPRFEAAMVHYAVNCASVGCPDIRDRAWRAETLRADLDAAARAYVNSPRGVRATERGLVVSRIYRWYREDFGGDEAGVIAHLRRFAGPELTRAIDTDPRIAGYAYDWDLNASR